MGVKVTKSEEGACVLELTSRTNMETLLSIFAWKSPGIMFCFEYGSRLVLQETADQTFSSSHSSL